MSAPSLLSRATRALVLVLALAFAWCGLADVARAQAPKAGATFYEDKLNLGFKVKNPKDWKFIPPQPNDKNLIGKYDPPGDAVLQLGGDAVYMGLHAWILKFDRRERVKQEEEEDKEEDEEKKEEPGDSDKVITIKFEINFESFDQWAKEMLKREVENTSAWRLDSKKEVKLDGLACTEFVYLGQVADQFGSASNATKVPVKAYAMVYQIEPHVDVAYLFAGPGRDKDWKEWETNFRRLAETFKRIPVEALPAKMSRKNAKLFTPGPPSALKDKKRAELQARVASQPGWTLMESPNYFYLSNVDDVPFLQELMERMEAIRKVYEKDYPQEKSRSVRAKRKLSTGGEGDGKKADDEDEDSRPEVTLPGVDADSDPAEVARTSVVRVCANRDQYMSYGGPGGSAGYWNWGTQELVFFDDKGGDGRNDTWLVLNHEAFHQFIFYFYGNISPHSWYNEGTGDFYSGFDYRGGRFAIKEAPWRRGKIKEMLNEGRYVPLKELVRYSQAQYYSTSKYQTTIGDHYSQGWSLVWFLRTGKGKAKGWDPAWERILDTYLEVLGETGKAKKAVDAAYQGVDFDALEKSWKAYVG
ncbi:MAG: hypothetical protein EPO68_14565 [Planctomycetota bacterium]|nr:MAG: hypothetical protein EPO68_14565 [Planctomycetota bacterium]